MNQESLRSLEILDCIVVLLGALMVVFVLFGKIVCIQRRTDDVILVNPASVNPHLPFSPRKLATAISIHLHKMKYEEVFKALIAVDKHVRDSNLLMKVSSRKTLSKQTD